jgi:hypothetical protein
MYRFLGVRHRTNCDVTTPLGTVLHNRPTYYRRRVIDLSFNPRSICRYGEPKLERLPFVNARVLQSLSVQKT